MAICTNNRKVTEQDFLATRAKARKRSNVMHLSVASPKFAISFMEVESAAGHFAHQTTALRTQYIEDLRLSKLTLPRAVPR